MESRSHIAVEKKNNGYNCAQAVMCTYCDLTPFDENTCRTMGDAFGSGMGNMEGTCGALTGAAMTLSAINHDRPKTVKSMKRIMQKFQERNHATQCRMLKGVDTHKVLRQCHECVADACEFLEQELDPPTK